MSWLLAFLCAISGGHRWEWFTDTHLRCSFCGWGRARGDK